MALDQAAAVNCFTHDMELEMQGGGQPPSLRFQIENAGLPRDICEQMKLSKDILIFVKDHFLTVQGGTPMAVTGEDSLSRWFGKGRLCNFVCSQISSGVRGQTAPGVCNSLKAPV